MTKVLKGISDLIFGFSGGFGYSYVLYFILSIFVMPFGNLFQLNVIFLSAIITFFSFKWYTNRWNLRTFFFGSIIGILLYIAHILLIFYDELVNQKGLVG